MNCTNCNTLLTRPGQKSFCSSSCSASYNNRQRTKKSRPACLQCGHEVKELRTTCCSRRCSQLHRSPYSTDEERVAAHKRRNREYNARYIAQKKFQTPVDEDLTAIKEFYKNCPDGYEVDHIKPISKGGAHSITNLQYLTISENRKKGAKILPN